MYTDINTVTVGAIALDHLSAITAMEADPASGLVDDINDRLAIADEIEVDDIVKDMRCDHTHGRLAIDELDALEEAARDRRVELAEAARRRTRKHLKGPRPVLSPEVCKRVGQYKARLRALLKAGKLKAGDVLYLHAVVDLPSVRSGHDSVRSDRSWAEEMGIKIDTMRRRRRKAERLKLIAARLQIHGEDGNSCAVHPIMEDGTQVFPDPEKPTRLGTGAQGGCAKMPTHTVLTELVNTELPPLPPSVVPDEPAGEGVAIDLIAEEDHRPPTGVDGPEAAADVEPAEPAEVAPQAPTEPLASRQVPTTHPPAAKTSPVSSAAMFFPKLWAAMAVGRTERQTGPKGVALAAFLGLSPAGKAKLMEIASRPGFRAPAGMWVGTFIKGGVAVWEEGARAPAAAAAAPARTVRQTLEPAAAPAAPKGKKPLPASVEAYLRGRVTPLTECGQ